MIIDNTSKEQKDQEYEAYENKEKRKQVIRKTCLHRLVMDCIGCTENYDLNKRPNNYDCIRYYEINYVICKS